MKTRLVASTMAADLIREIHDAGASVTLVLTATGMIVAFPDGASIELPHGPIGPRQQQRYRDLLRQALAGAHAAQPGPAQ